MAKYQAKPIIAHAVRVGAVSDDTASFDMMGVDDADWVENALALGRGEIGSLWVKAGNLHLATGQGTLRVDVGDYIVHSGGGEIAVFKPDTFEEVFTLVP